MKKTPKRAKRRRSPDAIGNMFNDPTGRLFGLFGLLEPRGGSPGGTAQVVQLQVPHTASLGTHERTIRARKGEEGILGVIQFVVTKTWVEKAQGNPNSGKRDMTVLRGKSLQKLDTERSFLRSYKKQTHYVLRKISCTMSKIRIFAQGLLGCRLTVDRSCARSSPREDEGTGSSLG